MRECSNQRQTIRKYKTFCRSISNKVLKNVKNLRKYGQAPFRVAVIHGGPGAPGSMAPVARELSKECGVLEPLQTAASLEGQLVELKTVLEENGDIPIILIGSSWGAMLSFIFSACYPALVKKIILVGSGVYEEKYAGGITDTRLRRLSTEDSKEAQVLMDMLNDPDVQDKDSSLARLGELLGRADTYNAITSETEILECRYHIHESVWNEARKLRESSEFLELGKHIRCPVVAVHGDYDPHPYEGIQKPLISVLKDFRFFLLRNCGHLPWIEKEAREIFYGIIREELQ